jgi:hypothetical protein
MTLSQAPLASGGATSPTLCPMSLLVCFGRQELS